MTSARPAAYPLRDPDAVELDEDDDADCDNARAPCSRTGETRGKAADGRARPPGGYGRRRRGPAEEGALRVAAVPTLRQFVQVPHRAVQGRGEHGHSKGTPPTVIRYLGTGCKLLRTGGSPEPLAAPERDLHVEGAGHLGCRPLPHGAPRTDSGRSSGNSARLAAASQPRSLGGKACPPRHLSGRSHDPALRAMPRRTPRAVGIEPLYEKPHLRSMFAAPMR